MWRPISAIRKGGAGCGHRNGAAYGRVGRTKLDAAHIIAPCCFRSALTDAEAQLQSKEMPIQHLFARFSPRRLP
jgi:hypothetical protein